MPTIEIVSVDSKTLELNQNDFDLAIRVENVLESHRGLFYDFLIKQSGTIVHIGNPSMKNEDGGFFAGMLLDNNFAEPKSATGKEELTSNSENHYANQCFYFKFKEQFKIEVDKILKSAVDNSLIKIVYFLSDFQFGPENSTQEIISSISAFWQRHDNHGLEYNKLYELHSY